MKIIKMGVFGLGRGNELVKDILGNKGEIVALCDFNEAKMQKINSGLGGAAAMYTDFDKFIEHEGLDAILIANYFHEHAPYAIKALEKGIHVITDCIAAGTMGECVALVRAVEKSNAIYCQGEDYQFMLFNQEMKRLYDGGTLGKLIYAEGEYNHPVGNDRYPYLKRLHPFAKHWRCWIPACYYVTHSLGPLMYMTGTKPKRISAMPALCADPMTPEKNKVLYYTVAERAGIMTTVNEDGSVFRFTGCARWGFEENSYRLCCDKGQVENIRGSSEILLNYNSWEKPEGAETSSRYTPEWHDKDVELIKKSGHGGSDFFVFRHFFDCIRNNKQPKYFDVYGATLMASVAILGHRSMLEYGVPYNIPDFRKEEDRVKWENDFLTPLYGSDGSEPTLPASTVADNRHTPEAMAEYQAYLDTIPNTGYWTPKA